MRGIRRRCGERSLCSPFASTTLLQEAEERASSAGNELTPQVTLDHVTLSFARSVGPGGQNVNKVDTKVDMRFNVKNEYWLSDRIRERIMQLEKKLDKQGRRNCDFFNKDKDAEAIIDAAAYVPPPPSEEQKKKIAKMAAIGEQEGPFRQESIYKKSGQLGLTVAT